MKPDTTRERTESELPSVGFRVGGEVSEQFFFGRAKEIAELSAIFRTDCSYSVVGPTRIGKSSLVQRVIDDFKDADHIIHIEMNMGTYKDMDDAAFGFWSDLWKKALKEAKKNGISFDDFLEDAEELQTITADTPHWYQKMMLPLQNCMQGIRDAGWRIVLALDEFDSVISVFGRNTGYFHLLRELFSRKVYCLNGVVISRSSLSALETQEGSISNLQGIFADLQLNGFDEKDMEEFYAALRAHAIEVTPDGRQLLKKYTGNMPYLCCLFARELVSSVGRLENGAVCVGEEEILKARQNQKLRKEIRAYYEALVKRLKKDDHLDAFLYLAFDNIRTAQYRKYWEDMREKGYLSELEENGEIRYYVYSMDFMEYLRRIPLNRPAWELLDSVDKMLKGLFGRKYPKLETIRYREYGQLNDADLKKLADEISTEYKERNLKIKLDFNTIRRNAHGSCAYVENPSILDALSLNYIIKNICENWGSFKRHFANDENWKDHLLFISNTRNPLAHSQHISEQGLADFNERCAQLIDLLSRDNENAL